MNAVPFATILHTLRGAVEEVRHQGLTDAEALRRFVTGRDEGAFAVLLQRHAAAVWSVCRRMLPEQDAEDAFQATFLVLARKADSVRRGEAVGSFLHGVAHRVAARARHRARARQAHERQACRGEGVVGADPGWRELQAALDEEVRRLPEKYRAPFVLCCLNGISRHEAGQELGCAEGTVSSRIARARALLERRLAARGVTLTAALTASTLCQHSASAAVPLALVRASALAVAGRDVSATAALLAGEATRPALAWPFALLVGIGLLAAAMRAAPPPRPAIFPAAPRADLFGDPLPPGAMARMGTVRFASGDTMLAYPAIAPDLRTFATVSSYTPHGRGRVVCLWDAESGRELRHLHDPDFEHFQAFYLRTENLLATIGASRRLNQAGASDYAMHFWHPATGKKSPFTIRHNGYFFEPWALSADEKLLAGAGRNPPVAVFDRTTGQKLAEWPGEGGQRVYHLAFSPDGRTVAIVSGKTIHLWDWRAGRAARRLGDFGEDVRGLWYSPDGRYLAAWLDQHDLRVWATADYSEARRFRERAIRFFPDGKRFLSIGTGKVWDVASGKESGRFERSEHCLSLEFSRDGKSALGYAMGRVRRWDVGTGQDRSPPFAQANRTMVHQLGFLPGGKEVITASADGSVRAWDAGTGRQVRTLRPGDDSFRLMGNYMRVAAGGTVVVARGKRLLFYRGDGPPDETAVEGISGDDLASLNVSPDGKHLVVAGGSPAEVQLWDVASRKVVAAFRPPEGTGVEALAVAPGGAAVAACVNHQVCLLDARTGRVAQPLGESLAPPENARKREWGHSYTPGIQAIAFSPDGALIATARYPTGGVTVLDRHTGRARRLFVPPGGNEHYELRNLTFSPDGRMLAAETPDEAVEVWELSSGKRRRRFVGHRSYQTALAFSPDGARLASGNRDATALVWDVFGTAEAEAGPLAGAWDDLGSEDAERACRAIGRLLRRPGESLPLLTGHLLARKSAVAAKLKGWVADLDSDRFADREESSRRLAENLDGAGPLLIELLGRSPSPEARRRAERLLREAGPRPLPAETLRGLRAVEVLEHIGPPADGALKALAEGDYDPGVAVAARAARKRLAGRAA